MKKIRLTNLACILVLLNINHANAQIADNKLLEETLSLSYGAPVKVEIDEHNCQVIYPEVKVEEMVYDKTDTEEQKPATTVIATLPETVASCVKVANFKDMPQYQVINKTPHKLLAQIYNLSTLSFVKDIDVKIFDESMQVVPQIGLVSGYKLHVADASYTQKDATTGLKSEIGNLKDLTVNTSITPDNNLIKYLTDTKLNNLNLSLPMMSMRIDSEHQVTEITYKTDENGDFDYKNVLQNFMALESSRSRAIVKGIKLGSDLVDAGLSFDMELKSRAERGTNENLDSTGEMKIDNIVFTGDMLEKSKQPKSIGINAQFNNIAISDFSKLSEIQQKALEADDENVEIDEDELLNVMENVLDKARLIEDMNIEFADADVNAHFELYRKNKYLYGTGEIVINNFYNIFPELKPCQINPDADECKQNPMFAELSQYIDLSKDHSVNLFEFNENGIFLNKKRVADPIEMDLKKLAESDDADLSEDIDITTDDESVADENTKVSAEDVTDESEAADSAQ